MASASVVSLDEARIARQPERWVGKRELAAHLNCSPRTVERYLRGGRYTIGGKTIPHRRVFGGPYQFRLNEVDRWLDGAR